MPSYPGYVIARMQMALRQGLDRILLGYALRRTQFTILVLLKYNAGARPSDLAATLRIKRANMVGLIEELVERALVLKQASPDDRRATALHLTRAGVLLTGRVERAVGQYEARAREILERDQAGMLHRLEGWSEAFQRLSDSDDLG